MIKNVREQLFYNQHDEQVEGHCSTQGIVFPLLIFILLFPINGNSQPVKKNQSNSKSGIFSAPAQFDHRVNGAYFKWYLHDSKELVIAPGRWRGKDWLIFGGTAAAAATIVLVVDEPVQDYFENLDSEFWDGVSKVLNPLKGLTIPVYAGFVPILYGLVTGRERPKKVGLEVLEAQLVTSTIHYPINWIASRTRPGEGAKHTDFNWIWNKKLSEWTHVQTSFPSGHSVLAFSSAAIIAAEFHEKKWVPPTIYGLAGLVGVQRLAQNRHWTSDVFYGAVVGHFMTKTLVREHEKANESLKTGEPIRSSLKIFPFQYVGSRGFRVVYKF